MNAFNKQLSSITSSFSKTLSELDKLTYKIEGDIAYKNNEIFELTAEVSSLEETKDKASKFKDNLNKLLGN